jgi:adenylosuccinate synthase
VDFNSLSIINIHNEKGLKMQIEYVDVCCGLAWGDEGKGKVVSQLARDGGYDFVCRWAGGDNAGHSIKIKNKVYATHLIPSGVFFGVTSVIGPGCVINKESFQKELDYLKHHGFDISLVKVSPKAHLVLSHHISEDLEKQHKTQGSTARGIAPTYRDKYARVGHRVEEDTFFDEYLWDEVLWGKVLCEGAQGVWLDIDHGNYPYVTSSNTLPYGACSLGFPPQKIRKIFGAAKIYDTRSGSDPLFPETLVQDPELKAVIKKGGEFGTTTGRVRKVNWLNLDKLIEAINLTGTGILIISKVDVLEELDKFKLTFESRLVEFPRIDDMIMFINYHIRQECMYVKKVLYSDNPEEVPSLL